MSTGRSEGEEGVREQHAPLRPERTTNIHAGRVSGPIAEIIALFETAEDDCRRRADALETEADRMKTEAQALDPKCIARVVLMNESQWVKECAELARNGARLFAERAAAVRSKVGESRGSQSPQD
jgi:hypothetical protein